MISKDSHCPRDPCAKMSNIIRKKLRQTKVSDLRYKVSIKKNITSFYVSMHNMWSCLFMQKYKPFCCSQTNCRSWAPTQFTSVPLRTYKNPNYIISPHNNSTLYSAYLTVSQINLPSNARSRLLFSTYS